MSNETTQENNPGRNQEGGERKSTDGHVDSMATYEPTIFERQELLTTSYIPQPDRIVGRDEELAKLEDTIKPVAHGHPPRDAVIISKPGTGKTLCARNVAGRAQSVASDNDFDLIVAYINGYQDNTVTQAAYRLAVSANQYFDSPESIPPRGYSRGEYFDITYRLLDDADGLIVILDEAEKLGDDADTIIKQISDAESNGNLPYTSTIAISNKKGFYENLESRVRSRLEINDSETIFTPYDANQLQEILEKRKDAFVDGVLGDGVIDLCAAFGAKEHGDARKAIDMLRAAGELAQEQGDPSVTEDHVRAVHTEAISNRDRKLVTTSLDHAQYALFALAHLTKTNGSESSFSTGNIYSTYEKVCEIEGRSPQTHQNILDHLKEWAQVEITENQLTGGGKAQGSYREHTLLIDPDIVLSAVQDETFDESVLTEIATTTP